MADSPAQRRGSRWIDGYPPASEVAEWFVSNAKVHEGLNAADFVDGVVIISQKEKMRVARTNQQGARVIVEEERMVHVPYMRVDARIDYFWRWMALHPEWVGFIEPVDVPKLSNDNPYRNDYLPPGFFVLPLMGKDNKTETFFGCSQKVSVIDRAALVETNKRIPIFAPTNGTKMVPTLGRWGIDPDVIMKAETSAVGRALGMLGVLTLGSGVATAEDMESLQAPTPAAEPELPAPKAQKTPTAYRVDDLVKQIKRLESDQPDIHAELESWARSRKIDLNAIKAEQVRAVARRLESVDVEAGPAGEPAGTPA